MARVGSRDTVYCKDLYMSGFIFSGFFTAGTELKSSTIEALNRNWVQSDIHFFTSVILCLGSGAAAAFIKALRRSVSPLLTFTPIEVLESMAFGPSGA